MRRDERLLLNSSMRGRSLLDAALSSPVTNGDLKAVSAAAWSVDGLVYEAAFGESGPGVAMRPDSMLLPVPYAQRSPGSVSERYPRSPRRQRRVDGHRKQLLG